VTKTNDELQSDIDMLKTQQAMTIKLLRAFLSGHLDGDGTSAAWLLAAIDPNGGSVPVAPFAFGP
jgi:hypothetical protein